MKNQLQSNNVVQKREHYITLENFYYDSKNPNMDKVQEVIINTLNTAKVSGKVIIDFSKIINPELTKALYTSLWGGVSALGGTFSRFDEKKGLYIIDL